MPKPNRVVSIRVPIGLPEQVKALTGMPFSRAVVTMFEAFVAAQQRAEAPASLSLNPAPKEPTQ